MSSFAVVLGLGIAVVATRYAGRLESRIRQQHAEVVENRRDLRRLSAKVVHAQEEERRRIARELHDEIGQALTAMKTELTLTEHHGGLSGKAAQSLAQARSITERTIETVRNLSELLHPATLDDFGLPDTLASYLKSFSERTGVRTELVQDRMAPRMPAELEVSAYRIVQEALTNIAKHAEATTCRVFVQHLPYSLLLTVEDDGKGFDPKRSAAGGDRGGLGLVGIRERASELGGTFRLEGSPGKGTRVTVELPIPSGVQEGAASQDLVSGVLPEER
jgi:signal transduction histidine kinase